MAAKNADENTAQGAETASAPVSRSPRMKLLGVMAGVMLLEGAAIFGALKLMGSGPEVSSALPLAAASQAATKYVEVPVVRIRTPNVKEGRIVLWAMEIVIRTTSESQAAMQEAIHANEKTITDRVARLIRSAEPRYLQEDGLETLKRQLTFELERVLGEDARIEELLIPECTPYPTGS